MFYPRLLRTCNAYDNNDKYDNNMVNNYIIYMMS